MLQRNDSGYPLLVGGHPSQLVEPDETVDIDGVVAGLTLVEPPAAPAGQPADDLPADPPAPRRARRHHEESTT